MQTINRNNYEEFFLLYIDDELDAASKLAVENFVQQNTDLAVELEMLLQSKSLPEEIVFADKDVLLRTEGNSINEKNHEEYFLLYIDNELRAAKREEVEMYVLQHPKLQDEFTTLKRAILTPEVISYGNKEDLYRTEKRRTVYLKSWRLAAAAIFIGICATGWWMIQKPAITITVVDSNTKTEQPKQNTVAVKPIDSSKQNIKEQTEISIQQEQIAAKQPSGRKQNKQAGVAAVVKKKKENITNTVASADKLDEEPQVIIQQPVITHNDIAKNKKEPTADINDIAIAPYQISQKQNNIAALQSPESNNKSAGNYKVYPVAYKEINTNDEDRSLYVGMLDLNKDKVKTLFKKAGRLFGNKSNELADEDGKLQVANFEIDTKKQ